MFWTLHVIGWLSPCCSVLFLEFWSILSFGPYFFVSGHLLCGKGWSLRYLPVWGDPLCFIVVLSVWGHQKGNNAAHLLCSYPTSHHFPCFPQADCELSCEAGTFSLCWNPHRFFTARGFESLVSLHWNPGFHGLSRSPVAPSSLSACECRITCMVHHLALPRILSAPATHLCPSYHSGWMFLSLLGCRTSMQMIFCQFWLFFAFKLVVILLLVVQGGKVFLPMPPSRPELPVFKVFWHVEVKLDLWRHQKCQFMGKKGFSKLSLFYVIPAKALHLNVVSSQSLRLQDWFVICYMN